MIDATPDAEVPRAGLGADDGGAGLEVHDDGEELIEVQRARFARLLEKLEGEGFDGSEHLAKLEATGTWPGADEGARRDLLLDSSAVRLLAADRELLAAYLRVLERQLMESFSFPWLLWAKHIPARLMIVRWSIV